MITEEQIEAAWRELAGSAAVLIAVVHKDDMRAALEAAAALQQPTMPVTASTTEGDHDA